MAIIYAVRERTQSKTAMRKVMEYVMQNKKTVHKDENGQKHKHVSGQNCCGDTAFKEFVFYSENQQRNAAIFLNFIAV